MVRHGEAQHRLSQILRLQVRLPLSHHCAAKTRSPLRPPHSIRLLLAASWLWLGAYARFQVRRGRPHPSAMRSSHLLRFGFWFWRSAAKIIMKASTLDTSSAKRSALHDSFPPAAVSKYTRSTVPRRTWKSVKMGRRLYLPSRVAISGCSALQRDDCRDTHVLNRQSVSTPLFWGRGPEGLAFPVPNWFTSQGQSCLGPAVVMLRRASRLELVR